ncbi:LOW QUALITY PROTEIN: hypothetical protein ACHAWF_009053, partial [Thalassiosira exigua]
WREPEGAKPWYFNLLPDEEELPQQTTFEPANQANLAAFSAYDLPSVEALVPFFHAAAGFPVRITWLREIKNGNYDSWPGLTYNNAARYCPNADETPKGHMTHSRPSAVVELSVPADYEPPPVDEQATKTNVLHVKVVHISRLYTNDTGHFPVRSHSDNQYIMIAFHCDANIIFACPFKTRKDKHLLEAYNAMMERLAKKELDVDLQILDNEASEAYHGLITKTWKHNFQLVPPICIEGMQPNALFAPSLSILAGVAPDFPRYMWDLLIPQAEMTLNFLCNAKSNGRMSAWEFSQAHSTTTQRHWDPWGHESSPTTSPACATLGTSGVGMAGALVLPCSAITIAASNTSCAQRTRRG